MNLSKQRFVVCELSTQDYEEFLDALKGGCTDFNGWWVPFNRPRVFQGVDFSPLSDEVRYTHHTLGFVDFFRIRTVINDVEREL